MNQNLLKLALGLSVLSALNAQLPTAFAQGTAFTYQGRLNDGGNLANGLYDFRSGPVATNIGGTVVAGPITNTAVSVSNGLFVLTLDFGPVFDGTPYWLQIGVRTNGGGAFIGLSPRPEVTPTPYAIFSTTASNLSGTLSAGQLSGIIPSADLSGSYGNALNLTNAANTFAGNGAGVTSLNANNLASGTVADARLSANVALRAGGNNLTGNQTVTSGNVGIGTTSPKTALQVNGPNGTGIRVIGPAGGGTTVAYDLSTYDPGTNPPAARLQATDNGNYGNDLDLMARIPGSATNALVSRLHIDSATGIISGNGSGLTNLNATQLAISGNNNLYVGPAGNAASSGHDNLAVGILALQADATGSDNTANGFHALQANANGSANTAIGAYVMADNTGGSYNTAIGFEALNLLGFNSPAVGGSNNIALGFQAGYNFFGNESGNIDIGNPGVTGENNIIRIGNGQTATYLAGTVYGNGSGLSSLNAANLSSGTLPDAQLSANVALRAGGNTFTGNQTVLSGGSVGIGTAVPQANLDVVAPDPRLRAQATSSGGFSATEYVTDGSTWHTGVGGSAVANGVAGEFYLYNANAGQFSLVANTNGHVGIGTTSPQYTLDVNGSASIGQGLSVGGNGLNVGGLTYLTGLVVNSGGYSADMHCDLNVFAPYSAYKPGGGSWSSLSDERLKKNIRPLSGALDMLTRLRGVTFEWIHPEDHANQTNVQTGFIAQEVERVFPDWIARVAAGEHDKALTADGKVCSLSLPFAYDALVVEAVKELRAEKDANLAELKARNQMLEQKLAAQQSAATCLEARLANLEKTIARLVEKSDALAANTPPAQQK